MNHPEKNNRSKSERGSWWYALTAIPIFVYLKGLAPSIVLGDTGDFLTAGWQWGTAHQPGYPLFTILVGIFERLPIQPIFIRMQEYSAPAWRANLLSMIFAVAALMVLFSLVNRITGKPVAAMLATGALAFSRVFWWHAEICENDSLSSLFILLLIYLSVRLVQDRRPGDPYWLVTLSGLAVSHHQSIVLFFPAIIIYLALSKALNFKPIQWTAFMLLFILGLAPFIYLPLAKYGTPDGRLNFISEAEYERLTVEDPDELRENRYTTTPPVQYFMDYIGRGVYSRQREYTHTGEALAGDKTTISDVFRFYIDLVRRDFGLILAITGVMGLFYKFRRRRKNEKTHVDPEYRNNRILIFTAWILYFLVVHFYPSGDILRAPFYNLQAAGPGLMLPLEVIYSIFIGLGISNFLDWAGQYERVSRVIGIATVIVGLVLIAINFASNYHVGDKSRNTLAHEYGLNALDSCSENSTLVVAGDEIFAFNYLCYVHPDPITGQAGYRPDVNLAGWAGEIGSLSELADISGAMTEAIVRISEEDPDREINTTFFNSGFLEEPALMRYTLARRGINFTFVPPQSTSDYSTAESGLYSETGVSIYMPGLPVGYRWEFWGSGLDSLPEPQYRWLWAPEADIQWRIGEMLLFYGSNALLKGDKDEAAQYFYTMTIVEPGNPEAFDYLALALDK